MKFSKTYIFAAVVVLGLAFVYFDYQSQQKKKDETWAKAFQFDLKKVEKIKVHLSGEDVELIKKDQIWSLSSQGNTYLASLEQIESYLTDLQSLKIQKMNSEPSQFQFEQTPKNLSLIADQNQSYKLSQVPSFDHKSYVLNESNQQISLTERDWNYLFDYSKEYFLEKHLFKNTLEPQEISLQFAKKPQFILLKNQNGEWSYKNKKAYPVSRTRIVEYINGLKELKAESVIIDEQKYKNFSKLGEPIFSLTLKEQSQNLTLLVRKIDNQFLTQLSDRNVLFKLPSADAEKMQWDESLFSDRSLNSAFKVADVAKIEFQLPDGNEVFTLAEAWQSQNKKPVNQEAIRDMLEATSSMQAKAVLDVKPQNTLFSLKLYNKEGNMIFDLAWAKDQKELQFSTQESFKVYPAIRKNINYAFGLDPVIINSWTLERFSKAETKE